MKNTLAELLEFYEFRLEELNQIIEESLAMEDYYAVLIYQKQKRYLQHKLGIFIQFENPFAEEIRILKREINSIIRWQHNTLSESQKLDHYLRYLERESHSLDEKYEQMENWEAEAFKKNNAPKNQTNAYFSQYLDQLINGEAEELSIFWGKRKQARVSIQTHSRGKLLIRVKGEKNLPDYLGYGLKRSPILLANGFEEKGEEMELIYDWQDSSKFKEELLRLCSRIVYDLFRDASSLHEIGMKVRLKS